MVQKQKRVFLSMLVGILLLGGGFGSAHAQDDTLVVSSANGSLSIGAPPDWSVTPPGGLLYGVMSNQGGEHSGEPLCDVQVIISSAAALGGVLDDPIDLTAQNPALDYLQKYAQRGTRLEEGVFAEPVALNDGDLHAAIMLYVETLDEPRFGTGVDAVLSLGVAVYLGEDQMAIMLMDGPAAQGDSLIRLWVQILPSLKINETEPAFVKNFSTLLFRFESPDVLLGRYNALHAVAGVPPSIDQLPSDEFLKLVLANNTVSMTRAKNWTLTAVNSNPPQNALIHSADGSASLGVILVTRPPEFQDATTEAEKMLPAGDTIQQIGETVAFRMDDVNGAALRLNRGGDRVGTLLLFELPDNQMLTVYFEETSDPLGLWEWDWFTMLRLMRLNGMPFDLPVIVEAISAIEG